MAEPFILDLESNPHDKMLDGAIRARRLAHLAPSEPQVYRYWQGYLDAMCDATGLNPEEVEAWVAHHDDFDPAAIGTSVAAPVRKRS